MIPKIEFTYSSIYEQQLIEQKFNRSFIFSFHRRSWKRSRKVIGNYIKSLYKVWNPISKGVLIELSEVTKLKWKERVIKCYITNTRIGGFSDPMTIASFKDRKAFIDCLVHELIHNLFVQNIKKTNRAFDYLFKKYKKFSFKTQIHIPVHAIHKHIYLKLFDRKRLKRDQKISEKYIDYKNAWDVVEKEGYKNVIKEFVKRVN